MPADTPPPRRNRHLARWFLVLIVGTFGWSGWRAYAFRAAVAQAESLGWTVTFANPAKLIRNNWKAAFKKETWLDWVTLVVIPDSEGLDPNLPLLRRLSPRGLQISNAATLTDLAAVQSLPRLQHIWLIGCTGLKSADGIQNLVALRTVVLAFGTSLTNVDALKDLPSLRSLDLTGCTALLNVDALRLHTKLELLTLSDCSALQNLEVVKNLTTLEVLMLKNCRSLTNVDFIKSIKSLQYLDLTGCTRLKPESGAAFRAALPKAAIKGP